MTFTIREVTERIVGLLTGQGGLAESLERLGNSYGIEPSREVAAAVRVLRASPDVTERALGAKYPEVLVYCDNIRSHPAEKLRHFSGEVRVVLEARVSQDRLDGIMEKLEFYCDGLRDVLERRRGCIGPGLYLSGEYEVQVEPVKRGGSQFVQAAKVTCTVIVNRY